MRRTGRIGARLRGCAALAALSLLVGCATTGLGGDAVRLSELRSDDPQVEASLRLVVEGLDADVRGESGRAVSQYQRALQVDASNPWAYLALARHYVEAGDAGRALSHLDRAETLLDADARDSPRVQTQLIGLRGAALRLAGQSRRGERLLAEAARRAPSVWGDGRLEAHELR